MTGEVVAGTTERLATGDAVNVAARLEQAAQPGEVLIGEATLTMVRDAVDIGAAQSLDLKGKSRPVVAYPLIRVHNVPERPHTAQFVGRQRELATVRDAWQRVISQHRCDLVTIIGDAGVGKSRLVAEALTSIDARVVRGRCLPYGEGITYWPVLEVLKQLDLLPADAAAAATIRSLLGETQAATSADEIAWAVRKTLEHAAADRPLIVVFDDIQWGEQTFRDLLEHVALLSSGASILLLCLARPELIERHPGWPLTMRLEPLGDSDVSQLMGKRTDPQLRGRIARAAGGNPLFIEEMLALAGRAGGDVLVPPTLQALLAARLDQLESTERWVLEHGAVEGEIFHRGAVQALAPAGTQVTPPLASLVRKELIWPDRSHIAGEDGFRFRHLLIRDAAYEALPKALRADLHHRLATWLEAQPGLVEADEIIGYHLEQSHRYRTELGLPDDPRLSSAAQRRLTTGGARAHRRSDYLAAGNLYERAAALVPSTEIDLALEILLGEVLELAGRGSDALRRADALSERASRAGNRIAELCGKVMAAVWRSNFEPEGSTEKLAALLEEAMPAFEASGNDLALYIGYFGLSQVRVVRGQSQAGLEAMEQAAVHARRADLPIDLVGWRASLRIWGTTPVSEVLDWLEQHARPGPDYYFVRAHLAGALARVGRTAESREILAETRAEVAERGSRRQLASLTGVISAEIELIAGHPEVAAELAAEGCRLLEELGDEARLSTAAGYLAQALYQLGRLDEAESRAERAAELADHDDVISQLLARQVRAKVAARRGKPAEAERLIREAVALAESTDLLDARGDAEADLAEVLAIAGRPVEAASALEQALERYERKGSIISVQRIRARLADLQAASG
jgi:tetratricopeptide (TPR) repeat protein